MNTINPLLTDHAQMKHRELNGETHPPHYLEIARIERSTSPTDVPPRTRSISMSINLDSLSAGLAQVFKVYWYVPAGFAVLVLARSIVRPAVFHGKRIDFGLPTIADVHKILELHVLRRWEEPIGLGFTKAQ